MIMQLQYVVFIYQEINKNDPVKYIIKKMNLYKFIMVLMS